MLESNLISSYRHTHTLESLIAELSNESSQEYESAERKEGEEAEMDKPGGGGEGDIRWDLGLANNAKPVKAFLELLMNACLLYCVQGQTECVCRCVCVSIVSMEGELRGCYSYSSFMAERIPS